MHRSAVALAAGAAAALTLGACGGVPGVVGDNDDSDTPNGKAATASVERFASATGPGACDLLTPSALRNVYGANEVAGPPPTLEGPPPPASLAECRRRSAKFAAGKVSIEKVDVTGDRLAKIEATANNGQRTFAVTVRNKSGRWLIDEIREK